MGGAPCAKRPLAGSAGRAHCKFFLAIEKKRKIMEKNMGKEYGPLGLAHILYRKRKDGAPAGTMMRTWATVSFRCARSFCYLFF